VAIESASIGDQLRAKLVRKTAVVGVIGLGYVGLPLAAAAARGCFTTLGFDIASEKVERLNQGRSYIDAVSSEELEALVLGGSFSATEDFARLSHCDVIVICVPTPLSRYREPDLGFVEDTSKVIAQHLRAGQLVVLESTTYPGTTDEVVKPILERAGLMSGRDFFLAFSPEREDPGNPVYRTATIPKVVSGDGPQASQLVEAFYRAIVERVVVVSSPAVAEAVKITENVFRAVNIALVNELKVIYQAMGIDVWEVVEAAATKPFGYMPFFPGPGLGGHCIPIDPFYLAWKSREYGLTTRFIELAGEINIGMPHYVVRRSEWALDHYARKSLGSSRILIVGLAYKKNVSDVRESPSLKIMQLLEERGARVQYHDPHVPEIPQTREHGSLKGRVSRKLTEDTIADQDLVLIATDHEDVDYEIIARNARIIVDTRNSLGRTPLGKGVILVKA
jgi:UDP-N-acetyl-D-glucosamine dehydrogenase